MDGRQPLWILLAMLGVLSCDERSRPPADLGANGQVCVPGTTQECLGAGRCEGAQRCDVEGQGWEECQCQEEGRVDGAPEEGEASGPGGSAQGGEGQGGGEGEGEGEGAGAGAGAGEGEGEGAGEGEGEGEGAGAGAGEGEGEGEGEGAGEGDEGVEEPADQPLGAECARAAECVSGICFEVLGNTSCTTPCCHEEECPAGFGCLQKGAGRYCLPGRLFGPGYTLDRPTGVACADAPNSCKSGLCEQRGDGGSLCRGTCCTDGQCLAAPCRWSRAGQVLRTFCDPLGILMGQGRTGDPCRDETDCHSGVCVAPGRCADLCCRTAECVGGTVCGFVGGIGDSVVRACVPSGGGGTASGQECLEDADCTSGNCIEGTCREVCCLDQHCAGGDACRPRPGIEPFLATVCVPPDSP